MTVQIKTVKWKEIVARRAADMGAKDGLEAAAEFILGVANEGAPLQSGELIGSGAIDFDEKEAVVYYDTIYAARLHQNPKFNFKNGRRGRWLKSATIASKADVLQYFGDALRLRFSGRKVG